MSTKRTRESNKKSHLSPDVIAALGSSAARRSLDKTSPDKDLPTNGETTPIMSTRSARKLKSPQEESFEDQNTYGTRSNGKKRVIDSVEAPEPPPAKRGRGRPSKNKTPRPSSFMIEDEEAAYDVRMALGESEPPEIGEEGLPLGVRVDGDTVYGPGSLIRHIDHIHYTEKRQPAAMGAALTILETKKREFPPKADKNGKTIIGLYGEPLRNIPGVPDKVSTELVDIWYQILLQDLCGATYTDLLNRLNSKLPASKFSNRIMNFRLRAAKFSVSPNDREISKGSLQVAAKLTPDQLRFNTCWDLNAAKTKMRQPERKDPEGWMALPYPAGNFDTNNHYITVVLAELNRCRAEGARTGRDWNAVFESIQKAKKASRRAGRRTSRRSSRRSSGINEKDTIAVGERDSVSSYPLSSSSRAASSVPDDHHSEADAVIEDAVVVAPESPDEAMSLDSMVRQMIGDAVADVQQQGRPVRGGPGIRQASRMDADIKGLRAQVAALRKEKAELAAELAGVKAASKAVDKWAREAFRDLKNDLEVVKSRV